MIWIVGTILFCMFSAWVIDEALILFVDKRVEE